MSRRRRQLRRSRRRKERRAQTAKAVAGTAKPSFEAEALEERIPLSATGVVADAGDATQGATEGNDVFTGDNADDVADARGGDDTFFGEKGADTLLGGAGNDELHGGQHDALFGGPGNDMLHETPVAAPREAPGDTNEPAVTYENVAGTGEEFGGLIIDEPSISHEVVVDNEAASVDSRPGGHDKDDSTMAPGTEGVSTGVHDNAIPLVDPAPSPAAEAAESTAEVTWDGAEQLDVLNPLDELSSDVELAQARFAESGPRSHSGDGPEEPGANLPVREAAEGGPIRVPDSTEGSRILIVEPQGFFARLWGAVRGFAGTARIGERGEDDAERNQRRPA